MTAESREFGRHRKRPRSPYHDPYVRYAPVEPAGRGEAIQALTRDVLIRRSLEISPSANITIISIIQGVALGLLAQNTFPDPSPLVAVQSFALLLVFVMIFYFYMTVCILLRWAPSFMDCFQPFVIAGLEIPPAFFLGNAVAWNAWLAAFWFGTMGGLWITTNWTPPSHFGDVPDAHRVLHRLLAELRLTTAAGGVAGAAFALLAVLVDGQRNLWGTAGAVAVLATIAVAVWRTELRVSEIHARYGVHRPPFN